MINNIQTPEPTRNHKQRSPASRKRKARRALGIFMVLTGAVLLTIISGYYAYSASARSQLDNLNFTAAPETKATLANPLSIPKSNSAAMPKLARSSGIATSPADIQVASASHAQPAMHTRTSSAEPPSPAAQAQQSLPASSYAALYPAIQIHPKFWGQPLWSDGEPYRYNAGDAGETLPDGYRVASTTDDVLLPGEGALAKRIAIPLIDVDSAVKELEILNIGDSRAYETPKHLVGHIPKSPNPGEIGNAWYFGHLESPIKDEGSVFLRLPEIPDLLRDGDDVFVELESENGRAFLYKVTRSEVIHEDDLTLYGNPDSSQITLVACVPRLVYDHRILVTAELVGIRDAVDQVQ